MSRPTGLSANAETSAVSRPKQRFNPRATLYSPPPSQHLKLRVVAMRPSPGSRRNMTSPRLTRSQRQSDFGLIFIRLILRCPASIPPIKTLACSRRPDAPASCSVRFSSYQTGGFYDEMFEAGGQPRPQAELLLETVQGLSEGQLLRYKHAADELLLQMGITFNVYGDSAGTERIFPFDLVPRIVPSSDWERLERGLHQRIHALNAFIDDIYR